jgi:hypothetical protein
MAYQALGLGTTEGDGTGDSIRGGGDKINDNFVEIYTLLGTGTALSSGISATATVVTLAGPSISGVASFADGSVSAPSITNTGDANTGIYFGAADTVNVTTGGTKRIDIDSSGLDVTGNVTATGTVEPAGDTASGDNAAIGYTSTEGLILTGQGSTNDVTIKNDADADVIEIPTGTTNVTIAGSITSGAGIVIANAGNIGSAGDTDAMAIASNGVVTFSQIPVLPDNSIDSDYYVDGSIDRVHLAADIIDGTKIANDAINSEHYAAGSIDNEHIADDAINSEHYAANSIDEEHIANDAVGSAELKTLSTLLIKNSAGSTLKTIHGAGA